MVGQGNPVRTILRDYVVTESGAKHWPSMTLATCGPDTSGPRVLIHLPVFRAIFPNLPPECDQILWPDGDEAAMEGLARVLMGGKAR